MHDDAAPLLAQSLELLLVKLESGIPYSSANGHQSTLVMSLVVAEIFVNVVFVLQEVDMRG